MSTKAIDKPLRSDRVAYRDPFTSLTRELFGWDPFGDYRVSKQTQSFAPSFEVMERGDAYVLRADLPGVKEDDVDVSLHQNVLSISGSRQAEDRKEGDTYYLYERSYGSFARSFSLPDAADGEKIAASLTDGVLTVTIGKKAESRPRKIALKK